MEISTSYEAIGSTGRVIRLNWRAVYDTEPTVAHKSYQLVSPKPLTRPFVLKYVKLLGFANQVSLPPLQAPWGVTHEWTPFVLPSGLPVIM